MRIGIDCRTILNPGYGEKAGVGYYTDRLVRHLLAHDQKNEYVLFFDSKVIETHAFERKNVFIRYFPFLAYRKILSLGYTNLLVTAKLSRERLDVLHVPGGTIPLTYPGRTVVTVHDLAIYRHPEWFPRQRISRKLLYPLTIQRADRLIAVSAATRKELEELFHPSERKVRVIWEGAERNDRGAKKGLVFEKYKISPPYFLFVGTLEPRKNVAGALRAFETALRTYPDIGSASFVIAGAKGWKYREIFDAVKALGLGDKVRFAGYVLHEEKITLMREAAAFVFPTLAEGFGLPVLEALTLGTPVISSRIPVIQEIAGDAALLVDPYSKTELARAMYDVFTDKKMREDLVHKGKARATKFSWDTCARETRAVYEELGPR